MSDRSSKMPIAIEMREAITSLAGQRAWNETRERWLERAARRASIPYRQAKSLFYGESNPTAETVERVRAAVRNRQNERLREAHHAYQELVASLARAEVALRIRDEDFHCNEIAALREILSGVDRAVAETEGE